MVLVKELTANNDLKISLKLCRSYLRSLSVVTFQRDHILNWFKCLCLHLTKIIESIGDHYKGQACVKNQNVILLHLTQIITSLSLLINIFVNEEDNSLVLGEARKCAVKQIVCCLESLETMLSCNEALDESSQNFVQWMDIALQKVAQIDLDNRETNLIEIFEEARHSFEEVLSHAMSIAQVSLIEDSKSIRGSCQVVLSTLNSLNKEINNSTYNGARVNLFINACSDKLCVLERKVNTAVLKLCLKTFSQFLEPLEKIHNFCSNQDNRNKIDELDSLIADFDLHVDRIMQIGLFAVACSSDFARGIKIRSCLASLEALEGELVPAMASALLDKSLHNVKCAQILMGHWMNQANCLQKLIYLIIDPFAFCQIIYEEASDLVDDLSNSITRKVLIRQSDIEKFLLIVKVLQTFTEKAQNEFTSTETAKVHTKLKDFNEVLEEVESASSVLLKQKNLDIDNCKRVLKRCKILLTVLKRIWLCFADDVQPIRNIATVSETQMTVLESKLENTQIEPTGNAFLDHIINRGRQILQDRSVLYKTPMKPNVNFKTIETPSQSNQRKKIPLLKLIHMRKLSFVDSSNTNGTSLDLQITDILNEVSNLSTSLRTKKI